MNELDELVDSSSEASDDSNEEKFQEAKAATIEYLNLQPEIRALITGSRNFGHQASTVSIILRLASMTTNRQYSLCLYYRTNDERDELIAILRLLLPQFQALNTNFKVLDAANTNDVRVIDIIANIPAEIEFGFTGGFDDKERGDMPDAVQAMRVRFYMQLQPYLWHEGSELYYNVMKDEITDLDAEAIEEGFQLHRSSYYRPIPALNAFDRAVIQNSPYAAKLDITDYLDPLITNQTINLCSVYGIGTVADAGPPLYNMCSGILFAQRADDLEARVRRPCVLLLFQEISNEQWTLFQQLVQDPNDDGFIGANQPSADFRAWHTANNVTARISWLGGPGMVPTLQQVQQRVAALQDEQLLVIYFGRVPQTLFDYLFHRSTFPPYFEGQATAATVFNFGTPFFKYSAGIEDVRFDYPTVPDLSAESSFGAGFRRDSAKAIFRPPASWISGGEDEVELPPEQMLSIIADAFDPEEGDIYFVNVGDFFHTESNDKLLWGLEFFQLLKEQDTEVLLARGAAAQAEKSKLEQLYDNLQGQSAVDLLTALGSGFSYDWLKKVATTAILLVTGAKSTINDEKTVVTLQGETSALSVARAQVLFVFTEKRDQIVTEMTLTITTVQFSLPGVEWLQFPDSSVLKMTLDPTVPVPARGELTTTLKAGVTMTISLKIPTEQGAWAMQAVFGDDFPDLNSIFQLVGGINLTALLPSQIQAFAALKVRSLGFAYNFKTSSLEYFSIAISTPDGSSWDLVPSVTVQGISLQAMIDKPGDIRKRRTKYGIGGTFGIAEGTVSINANLPPLEVSGGMTGNSKPISIAAIIASYLGTEFAQALPASIRDTNITALSFGVFKTSGLYNFSMAVTTNWDIDILGTTVFTITELAFAISAISRQIDNSTGSQSNRSAIRLLPQTTNGAIRNASSMAANASTTETEITGNFTGSIVILPNSQKIGLNVSAAYLGSNAGWTFEAKQTSGQVSLLLLMSGYLPEQWQPSQDVRETFDVLINGLGIKIETKTNSWEFTGKTATPISIPGTGIDINLNLRIGYNGGSGTVGGRALLASDARVPVMGPGERVVSLSRLAEPVAPKVGYFGTLSAVVTWENIEITVFYDFNPDYKSFGITWGILEGKITQKDNKTIATLGFKESTTIGSIAETMISWATGSRFTLASPWNILNSIPLNNLSLEYNFTDKQVGINVGIGPIEMGFARIDSIKITYKSNQPNPEDNGVQVELVGSFRWQQDPGKPLGWNAAKPETTPAPQGQGNKYLDLRLLAMGQHVTLPCFADANTVQEAIACMKKLPVPDQNNIMVPPVTLDANSSWLIGMDFGVLRFGPDQQGNGSNTVEGTALLSAEANAAAASGYFITMQIVFNDPNLYALRIKLDGDAAKVLKGLDFQILYKKISDTIGMYKAEIALPDKMRFIRMGQLNITLPVFGIEYYTNGDFQVDIGFPWNADFSRSLTFQTLIWTPVGIPIPVMGSLGVYFGKLSSATTDKVPKATNGTFNPVLVFGFGIQFGIGYTFDVGILKAGFSLTAVAILEGVVAKFNPYSLTDGSRQLDQVETSYYFWLKGTVGIIGKLFGTIDFAIIKASVNIDIRILASFTFAPYEPIVLNLTASVEVEVSVKINLGLFKITISFSFSAKISQSVTIKAIGSNPPWQVAQGKNLLAPMFMVQRRGRRWELPDLQTRAMLASTGAPNWKNLKPAQAQQNLTAYMTLGLTMAGDTATTVAQQIACYVAMMFIDSVQPPQADRTGGAEKAFGDTPDTSFELLAKMILRWGVAALQPAPVSAAEVDQIIVGEVELQALLDRLNDQNNPTPIPSEDIQSFMAGQFKMAVEGPTTAKQVNATYFPVAPAMTLSLPKYGSSDALSYTFAEYNATSSDYLKFLREYFNQLAVKVEEDEKNQGLKAFALDDGEGESLGSFIFDDYFLMICRQMIQSALDSLREFKYYLNDGDTPDYIVGWINSNAGLTGPEAYNRGELFTDNAGVALNPNNGLRIEGGTYVVQANDTFNSIAANPIFGAGFNGAALATLNADTDNTLTAGITITYPGKDPYVTQPGESLKTVAENIEVSVSDLINNAGIASLANLPLAVATLQLPGFTHTTAQGDTLRNVAAMFRIDQIALAAPAANGTIVNLFDLAAVTLDIANLTRFKTGELIKEIQATQGLQHLSGMTSRYYMAGLRLPTNGITPEKKGMWVTGDTPEDYTLPDFAGLYALTGQQFAIPTLNTTDAFNVDFNNGGLSWLTFVNSDPAKLQISVKPGTDDAKQIDLVKTYATANRLNTGLSFLGLEGMFNTKAATYSFNSQVDWNAASSFSMPYGGMPPGVPDMQLWLMPDSLMALPDLSTRKVNPRMAMKVGEYNEAARAMVDRDLDYYGYASMVEFVVKRVPVVDASPSTLTTYEVIGADGSSARVLERIVSEIGANDSAIQTLILAYPSNPNSTTSSGIQTDAVNGVTMGLAQVNLSTETRPDTGFNARLLAVDAEEEGMRLLNKETDFIRLLWEAGITRAGGYFLYYFNSASGGGLPERVFNDKGEALLTLVVLYAKPADTTLQGNIGGYMNALVTGQSIDLNTSQLFAEANPNTGVTIPASATQTLAAIAYEYFGNVSQVAADNADLQLRANVQLEVSEGTYEVGPNAPAGNLSAIADWFGTSVQKIKEANPKITAWPDPLPLYTALYLPELTIVVGTSKGGTTLGSIADYYGMNRTALASRNSDVVGIFADGGSIKISGGPIITTSTVPPGNVTLEAVRPKPPEIPDTPTGSNYGEIFLLNMYSLLSYQVASNPYFSSSALGLPATPSAESEEPNNLSKVRAPKAIAVGDDWIFRQAVPYNQFSLQTPKAAADLPDPQDSPYRGLGDLLQVDFAWQDLYGNRLITVLSNPQAGDSGPLNMSPVLTGYSDPIIGLQQWPSVVSTYAVVSNNGVPAINLLLTFDPTVYQGLIGAQVKSATTIDATFTEALDKDSAERIANYSLDNNITVLGALLGADNRTVTLTVDAIPVEVEISLTIAGIADADRTQTFQGVANFFSPVSAGLPTSTLLQKAIGDLNTYTQLWYQLTDPYGIGYRVTTSLTVDDYTLDAAQTSALVDEWLASIWRFVNDRAQGGITVPAPASELPFSFPIVQSTLNPDEIYRLDLGFTIERTGGAIMGDLETTGGIASVTTPISPFSGAAGDIATDLTAFAQDFEEALSNAGQYELRVATSVDRKAALSEKGGNELWVVRLGLDPQKSISYRISDVGNPLLFAPKPVSTKLQNRTGVPIWDFNPETGIDFNAPPSRLLDFTGIDMDIWGRQFFGDFDNVLAPEFTAAIQLVDNNKGANYLEAILNSKKELADIVKDWMDFVFEGESGSTADIREAFRQQILVRLSNAYNVKAGVQYSARVQAGAFRFLFAGIGSDDTRNLILLFTSDIDESVAQNTANYTVSGGLTVSSATQNPLNRQIVTLRLSAPAIPGQTIVTVGQAYSDSRGSTIVPPLNVQVSTGTAATPEIFGNIVQNFKFLGAALDAENSTQVFLFFSGTLDKVTAENLENYTVSGLSVTNALLDAESLGLVTLTLSGNAIVGETTVTVADTFTDTVGQSLLPPTVQTVSANVDVSHRTRGISITSSKLNLKNSDSVPLPFLLSGPQIIRSDSGAVLSFIDLDTTYQGSAIEHQIGTLANVADYRASTWLSFLDEPEPLTADLGFTKVPMILRSFPASPSMVSQEGTSSYPISPDDLEKILQWDYAINYSQTIHYPQDELYFTVNFNVQDNVALFKSFEDAFAQIAEFITVYPDVNAVFRERLIKIDAETTDQAEFDASATALESFNAIVQRIVDASAGTGMTMASAPRLRGSNVAEPYLFRLKEGSGTVGSETEALVVTIIGKPPSGIDDPVVEIPGFATQAYTGTCQGDFCFYFEDGDGKPLSAAVGQGIGPRTVLLPKMNILQRQDAETTVELKRNVDLVPGRTTAPDFIYTTGDVGFANPLYPLIQYDQELPMQSVGGGGNRTGTLQQLLTEFFAVLLAENTQDSLSFLMTCTYAYQVNPILDPVLLPVVMQPKQSIDVKQPPADNGDRTLAEMIDAWSGSILLWFNDHQTSTQNGVLQFDLTIFTNLTEQNMPLLRLSSLVLALQWITNIPAQE